MNKKQSAEQEFNKYIHLQEKALAFNQDPISEPESLEEEDTLSEDAAQLLRLAGQDLQKVPKKISSKDFEEGTLARFKKYEKSKKERILAQKREYLIMEMQELSDKPKISQQHSSAN